MLKINKKEQSLWNLCSKIEKRTAPSKQEVWMRLEQQLDISSEPKKTSPAIVSNKIKSLFPRLAVALFIMILFLFTLNAGMGNMWNDNSEIEYIFSGRLGLCVSGLAGLGLIPGVTDRIFLKGGGAPTSKTPNSEDSLEDTGLQ